ncbi:MAG: TolC family protein, partial [Saprospiraceae bacterium]|nr:TolC family protein [Saprospiraceae bacterium]
QEQLSKAKLMPRVNFFTTLGYGRPGLNMLSNEFDPYALVGLNFKWNLHPLYTGSANREKQQLRLQSERIAAQRDQYLLQNSVAQQQQIREIERLNNLLAKDQRIVSLRDNMVETAAVQLENGVITSSEYLTETTNATTARMNARLHEIQLLQAKLMLGYLNGK